MAVLKKFGWKNPEPVFYHKYIYKPIEKMLPKDGSAILDMGCGNGYLANRLMDNGYCVYGIDISEDGIIIANKKNPGHFFVMDAESGELPAELMNINFRTIISTEVVEHLYNPVVYANTVHRILSRNKIDNVKSVFILSTPYHGYFKNIMLAVCNKMDYHFSAHWVGGHIKFWSKKTLCKLLSDAGFSKFKFVGAGRFPYLWRHMIIKCECENNSR